MNMHNFRIIIDYC